MLTSLGSVKFKVVRGDGSHEVLTLVEPVKIVGNSLVSGTGMSHHFIDGAYDGWSMPCNFEASGDDPLADAFSYIQAIEDDREIEP